MIILLTQNIKYINKITYIYKENKNSITRRNNREYKIFGLDGYTYNIRWAMDEAIKRNVNPLYVRIICYSNLYAMYYYYLEYYKNYEVEPLLKWSKRLIEIYDKYSEYTLKEEIKDIMITQKDRDYKERNIVLDRFITFEEFLEKVRKSKLQNKK